MRVILMIIFAAAFSSCVQKRYIHTAPPVLNPMFKDKGEGFASAFYTTNNLSSTNVSVNDADVVSSVSNGLALQGGYAFSKHFGITGGLNYINQKDNYSGFYSDPFDASRVDHKRTEFTLAGDWFFINHTRESGMNFLFGATIGKLKIQDAGKTGSADYSRYFHSNSLFLFVQPCLNVYIGKNSALGFSTRFNYVNYSNNQTNYSPQELASLRLDNTASLYVAEVGMKGSIGLGDIPFCIEPQFNYIWNHSGRIHVKRMNFSLGVSYKFRKAKAGKD